MRVEVLPGGGKVEINGLPVARPVVVAHGQHRLAAYAPGYRKVVVGLTAGGDGPVVDQEVRLPFAVKPSLSRSIRAILAGKSHSGAALRRTFALSLPPVVVLADAQSGRLAVIRPDTDIAAVCPEHSTNPSAWVIQAAKDALGHRGLFLGFHKGRPGWWFRAGASAGFVVRQQTLEVGDGPSIRQMQSSGPSLAVSGAARRRTGQGDLAADLSITMRAPVAGGGNVTDPITLATEQLNGGTTVSARISMGYQRRFVEGRLALVAQLMAVGAVHRNTSDDFGFFPGYQRVGAGAHLSAFYELSPTLRIDAGVDFVPFHYATEAGSLTLGNSIRAGSSDISQFGALTWLLPGVHDYEISVRIAQDTLKLRYDGTGTTRISPRPVNAVRTDVDWDTFVILRRPF